MNQREKFLGAVVGGLMVLVVLFFGYATASEMLRLRKQRVESLEKEVAQKNSDVTKGLRAAKQMARFAESSLPSDRQLARSMYQAWLLDKSTRIGLEQASVKAMPGRPRGDVYYEHTFTVSGRGDLKQLTDLLHDFYSRDILHRVRLLHVNPVSDSTMLDLTVQIDVLSLTNAPTDGRLPENESNRLAHSREEYLTAILNRNLFGPPNKAPQLTSVGRKEVRIGDRLSMEVSAKDEDQRQSLRYSLVGEVPEGMRIDARSGRVEFPARALGEYRATVQVADNGWPNKTDETTFTVAVVEPPPPAEPRPEPPPKPQFNMAQFSVLTAITEKSGRKLAWINIRPEGRTLRVGEGEKISIGDVTGIIREIAAEQVYIETEDDMLVVALGRSLTEAERSP
ncbi:MAG: cadherin repeat domain-containing protein [Planctomycetales bacterium]|nr:cadherin repeat domain-containing protein [Planctomycetales bacterium]